MTTPDLTIRRATSAEVDRVVALLEANDLPHQDVRRRPHQFSLADAGNASIGTAGLEVYGSNGLLRSVAVAEPYRGQGYGNAICAAMEDRAQEEGVERLYLLTTTAAEFFRQRGYETEPRATVPASVRETTEFADRCPDSATCMRKDLE